MAGDFAALNRKLDALGKELSGAAKAKRLRELGVAAKKDAEDAVRAEESKKGSLADLSMSNWRRGKPIKLGARYDLEGDDLAVTPAGRSKGPWRVLEEGRQGGAATDLMLVGRVRKDGTRRARSRGRNIGSTDGKGTWSDAEKLMQQRMPKRVSKQVHDTLAKLF